MDKRRCTATQVNAVSVETPHGLRTFELYSGDMFSQAVDLMVISTHHREQEQASGPLVETLRDQFAFEVDASDAMIQFGGGISACAQPADDSVPFHELLTMRIAAPRLQKEPAEFYDRAIQSTFASVAMLEFLGRSFESIALPVLVREGIIDYSSAVRSLLRHALTWLRRSQHTNSVRYYVYHPDELVEWDAAMNASLGRTYVDAEGESVLRGLCREIVSAIDSGVLRGYFDELDDALRNALANPDRLCVQTIATFGRKLSEVVTEQVCRDLNLPLGRDLLTNIEAVRNSKMLAAWIASYLHSLRVFGNEGVHSLAVKRGVVPSALSTEDLLSIFCAIRAVIQFWRVWRRERHSESQFEGPDPIVTAGGE